MSCKMFTHFLAFIIGGACGVFALAIVIAGKDEK